MRSPAPIVAGRLHRHARAVLRPRSPLGCALAGHLCGCWLAASHRVGDRTGIVILGLAAAALGFRAAPLVFATWLAAGLALASLAHAGVEAAQVREPVSVHVEGIVGSDPDKGGHQVVRVPGGRIRLAHAPAQLELGARVEVWGRLTPRRGNPVQLRLAHYGRVAGDLAVVKLVARAPPPVVLRPANAVRRHLEASAMTALPRERGALLLGLLIGDDGALPQVRTDEFRSAGLSHLLAVSGSNLVFVMGAVTFVVSRLPIPRRWRLLVAALAVVFYVLVTRPEPSVLRATVVAALSFSAAWVGTLRDPKRGFLLAVLAMVVCDPFLAASTGLQLSAAATAGILWWSAAVERRIPRLVPRFVRAGIAITIAAQVAVAPILVWRFGSVSLVGFVANVPALPLAGVLTVAGAALALFTPISPHVFALLDWPLRLLLGIGSVASRLPLASISLSRTSLAVCLVTGAGMWVVMRRTRVRAPPRPGVDR